MIKKLSLVIGILIVFSGFAKAAVYTISKTTLEQKAADGDLYMLSQHSTLAGSATMYYVIDLASNTVTSDVKIKIKALTEGTSAQFQLYSSPLCLSSGTVVTPFNVNTAYSKSFQPPVYESLTYSISSAGSEKLDIQFGKDLPLLLENITLVDGTAYLILITNLSATATCETGLELLMYEDK